MKKELMMFSMILFAGTLGHGQTGQLKRLVQGEREKTWSEAAGGAVLQNLSKLAVLTNYLNEILESPDVKGKTKQLGSLLGETINTAKETVSNLSAVLGPLTTGAGRIGEKFGELIGVYPQLVGIIAQITTLYAALAATVRTAKEIITPTKYKVLLIASLTALAKLAENQLEELSATLAEGRDLTEEEAQATLETVQKELQEAKEQLTLLGKLSSKAS